MAIDSTVTVYSFRTYDAATKSHVLAKFKAPRELIATRFKGDVLEGTEEIIDASALDREGRFRRIATGWGELS